MCDSCHCTETTKSDSEKKIIEVHESLFAANNEKALANKKLFAAAGAVVINMISSPGAGKTTLLEQTIDHLAGTLSIGVIEGDIETERDADRIRAKGVPAVQITTGGACHLDAGLIHTGMHKLMAQGNKFDIIFIENVGNLVCPASFYLGEDLRMVLLSVPEGSDKPAKYPGAFKTSDLYAITKTDLLPYFDFSMEEARKEALQLNPELQILELAAPKGTGLSAWIDTLQNLINGKN
ncbi:MAG: hydrogenase nickel incorporation protein HypB [Desulfobulbaceae bacterium]|nr:hydrogenase nickel incorporation protein HypB [Desulfobulbaceae bacterium]